MNILRDTSRFKALLKNLIPVSYRDCILNPYYHAQEAWMYHAARLRMKSFIFDGSEYRYFVHRHNHTYLNERAVELPIAIDFVNECRGQHTLEIGNVLSYYLKSSHEILDKYEKKPGVINEDILVFAPAKQYDRIISISTFEHIGFDEGRYSKIDANVARIPVFLEAVERTKQMLAPCGVFLMTVPLGANPTVDEVVYSNQLPMTNIYYMKKISRRNIWQEVDLEAVIGSKYGQPYPPGANAFVIAEFIKSAS